MIDDAELAALADGELHNPKRRRAVEAAVAADPALAARLAQHRALRDRAHAAFADILDEPVPERLRATALAPAPARRLGSLAPWAALAATLAVGVLIGRFASLPAGPIVATSDGLAARGALARALDDQLSDARGGPVEVAFSFAGRDGGVCRAFVLTDKALSGLACRRDGGWTVAATAATAPDTATAYRAAGSALPPAVLAAVDARIAGDAFGLDEERRARAAKWTSATRP